MPRGQVLHVGAPLQLLAADSAEPAGDRRVLQDQAEEVLEMHELVRRLLVLLLLLLHLELQRAARPRHPAPGRRDQQRLEQDLRRRQRLLGLAVAGLGQAIGLLRLGGLLDLRRHRLGRGGVLAASGGLLDKRGHLRRHFEQIRGAGHRPDLLLHPRDYQLAGVARQAAVHVLVEKGEDAPEFLREQLVCLVLLHQAPEGVVEAGHQRGDARDPAEPVQPRRLRRARRDPEQPHEARRAAGDEGVRGGHLHEVGVGKQRHQGDDVQPEVGAARVFLLAEALQQDLRDEEQAHGGRDDADGELGFPRAQEPVQIGDDERVERARHEENHEVGLVDDPRHARHARPHRLLLVALLPLLGVLLRPELAAEHAVQLKHHRL
mmetsp:Transcript_121710/g.344954  ORF Transcript_121710/g.344954 Transcript_121710/m.344954 type:complete len:377 (-) Transcript_121710:522-1652(-)